MVKRIPDWLILLLLPAAHFLSSGCSPQGDGGGDGSERGELDSLAGVAGEGASSGMLPVIPGTNPRRLAVFLRERAGRFSFTYNMRL